MPGGFWFTDHGKTFARSRDVVGVFYAKADGSHIQEAVFPMENPNGIGLSPDGKRLYVAETYTAKLWAFDLDGPGKIAGAEGLTMAGGHFLYGAGGYAWFDSLGVEAEGNICVATIGTGLISVISPSGRAGRSGDDGRSVHHQHLLGRAGPQDRLHHPVRHRPADRHGLAARGARASPPEPLTNAGFRLRSAKGA